MIEWNATIYTRLWRANMAGIPQVKGTGMKLSQYFEQAKGVGVLATTDASGQVNQAIYADHTSWTRMTMKPAHSL